MSAVGIDAQRDVVDIVAAEQRFGNHQALVFAPGKSSPGRIAQLDHSRLDSWRREIQGGDGSERAMDAGRRGFELVSGTR